MAIQRLPHVTGIGADARRTTDGCTRVPGLRLPGGTVDVGAPTSIAAGGEVAR